MRQIGVQRESEWLRRTAERLRARWVGSRVRLLRGRYAGREAVLDGVTLTDEGPRFLCMVTRMSDPEEYLCSDAETRAYRRAEDFEVLER